MLEAGMKAIPRRAAPVRHAPFVIIMANIKSWA